MKIRFSLALLALLTACGTSPEPSFYTLGPVAGTVATDVHDHIRIGRPALAGFLDRPEFVSQTAGNQLRIDETVNWAEPLDTMAMRVLADDVQQRLPSAVVETDGAEAITAPRFVVETAIQQFNPVAGRAVLRGQMILNDQAAPAQPPATPILLAVKTRSDSHSGEVAALSRLLGAYADQIVLALHAHSAAPAIANNN